MPYSSRTACSSTNWSKVCSSVVTLPAVLVAIPSTLCIVARSAARAAADTGAFAIVEALLDRMAAAPPPPRRLAASLAHRSCVAAPPSLVVRLAFRVGTVNGHRSRARRAALRLALRRAHDATSFCHLGPFCHLKPFCHLVSPRRVATTRPPTHPPCAGGGGGATPLPPATLASPAARPVPYTAPHPLLLSTLQYSLEVLCA